MLSAVHLNYDLLFRYVKINYIVFNIMLPPYVKWESF